jgi:hypothetical protein
MKDHWKEQRLFLSRIIGAAVVITLLTGLLVWRLVDLQVLSHDRFLQLSDGNQIDIVSVAPHRNPRGHRRSRCYAQRSGILGSIGSRRSAPAGRERAHEAALAARAIG